MSVFCIVWGMIVRRKLSLYTSLIVSDMPSMVMEPLGMMYAIFDGGTLMMISTPFDLPCIETTSPIVSMCPWTMCPSNLSFSIIAGSM